jgi:hypothetical protein
MSEGAREATTRSSLQKELAARTRSTRSTRSSSKSHRLNLLQPGNIEKQTLKSLRQKSLQETNKQTTNISFDRWVTFQKLILIVLLIDAIHKSNTQNSLQETIKQPEKVSL